MPFDKPKRGQPGYVSPLKGRRQPGHPSPLKGTKRPNLQQPFEERYWAKVSMGEGGCWVWTGCINTDGYGKIWLSPKMRSAHHFPWIWSGKAVPDRPDVLDHICKLRRCVNPDHLRVVTQRENSTIYAAKGATHCPSCGNPLEGANLALIPRKATGKHRRKGTIDVQRQCLTCYPRNWRYAVIPRKPPPGARLTKAEIELLNQRTD